MAIKDHESGGAVAAALRHQLGLQDEVRKARTCALVDEDGNVRKAAAEPGPRSVEFASALLQAAQQLGAGSGTPHGEADAIAGLMRTENVQWVGADGDQAREPRGEGYSDGGRQFVGESDGPAGVRSVTRTPGDEAYRNLVDRANEDLAARQTVVRKDKAAAALIEKAAAMTADRDELDPVRTLATAQAMVLEAFRKSEGRDPLPEDDNFWSVYRDVIKAVAQKMNEDTAG